MVSLKEEGGLGFRDLFSFNMATLAKQGWRLIHNPSSLCAQILKAKYYHDKHLLNARVKEGCSYTWRSIMHGVKTLKDGIIWRIGGGHNVNIWEDPWLPRGITRKPMTPRGRNLVSKVNGLIDPVTEKWDTELIENMFWEPDVQLIQSIPVHTDMDDMVGWHFDTRGQFSIKSAYRVHRAVEARSKRRQGGSSVENNGKEGAYWKKLWNLDCQPKIKHFLWRLSHNTVAVRRVLKQRGMKLDTRCCVCNRLDEDRAHLFLKCREVKAVWRELQLEEPRLTLSIATSSRDLIERIFKLQEKEQLTVILLLWFWWNERNTRREEGRSRAPAEIAYITVFQTDRWLNKSKEHVLSNFRQRKGWEKPNVGELKLNSDEAFNPNTKRGGWGFVIRDDQGRVVKAATGGVPSLLDVFHAEVLACY